MRKRRKKDEEEIKKHSQGTFGQFIATLGANKFQLSDQLWTLIIYVLGVELSEKRGREQYRKANIIYPKKRIWSRTPALKSKRITSAFGTLILKFKTLHC